MILNKLSNKHYQALRINFNINKARTNIEIFKIIIKKIIVQTSGIILALSYTHRAANSYPLKARVSIDK